MQRAIGLALVAIALAACAQPGHVDKTSAKDTSTSQPGVTIANPRAAEATPGATPFPAVPAGYRGLGGALMVGNTLTVVTPDMSAPMQKHDLDVGLLHGIAARGYSETAPSKVQKADCQGAGDSPQTAIKVANLVEAADEVGAGIACAGLLHPGTRWLMSQLVTNGGGYISQVALRDTDGKIVLVYTDINRMADQLVQELGG
jgi:hypothetical protein